MGRFGEWLKVEIKKRTPVRTNECKCPKCKALLIELLILELVLIKYEMEQTEEGKQ